MYNRGTLLKTETARIRIGLFTSLRTGSFLELFPSRRVAYRRKGKEMAASDHYQSPITEQWFSKANAYKPKEGTDYGWVWDYAKFRFAWAADRARGVDNKALEFIKLIAIAFAGFWPTIKLLSPASPHHPRVTLIFIVLSYAFLALAGAFALWSYFPKKRMVPVTEEAALVCADNYKNSAEAVAKFCQTLSASTEFQLDIATRYGRFLKWSVLFLLLAFICLTFSFLEAWNRML